jgi:hypothetical protein
VPQTFCKYTMVWVNPNICMPTYLYSRKFTPQ